MSRLELPPLERIVELLDYEANTGLLRWKKKAASNTIVGAVAGCKFPKGEIKVRIDGKLYMAHRIIWKIITGDDPPGIVDHENLIRHDNKWLNLRLATPSQNNANCRVRSHSKIGLKGVQRSRTKSERYAAYITVGGNRHYLGSFHTAEEASAAYANAASRHYGEFARCV